MIEEIIEKHVEEIVKSAEKIMGISLSGREHEEFRQVLKETCRERLNQAKAEREDEGGVFTKVEAEEMVDEVQKLFAQDMPTRIERVREFLRQESN